LVTSVVSTIDVVNCKSVQVQITGTTPTMVVDKTEGLQVYVSKESINLEVFTAKSSEVNLLFEEMGEWIEKAVSEQFKTVIRGGKLESIAVEHKG
jgi:adenylyl cyclase-associated protein